MIEHIERARKLNHQASDDLDHGRLEAAKAALNEAIRLAPDLAAPHTNLGVLHCWKGELEEAIALHLKARHWQGRFDEAIERYKIALETDPTLAEPHNNLGLVYLARDEIDRAIAAFNAAIEAGNLQEAHINLSRVPINLESVDVANLQVSPIGVPIGVPAVWCEIVD